MFLRVDLKSPGSKPSLTEMLDTSEQVLIADIFRCKSADNFRDVLRRCAASMLLELSEKIGFYHFYRRLEVTRSITRLPVKALLGEVATAIIKICSFGESGTTNELSLLSYNSRRYKRGIILLLIY